MLIDSQFAALASAIQTKADAYLATYTANATPAGRTVYFQIDELIILLKQLQGYTDKAEYENITGVSD